MPTVTRCLECETELSDADASGLCPKCLLKLGLASQLAAGTLPVTAVGLRDGGTIVEPFDFGQYRILRLLGKGGMGAVYEAEDRETQRRVALKVLGHTLDTAEMRQRFLREGQIAASVSHPNIVGIFRAEEIEATPVIAMELVRDGTLRDRVQRNGPLPPREAVDLVLQMIDGLEAAHSAGVLHRDIKPANCFITPDGVVKVGDFGLSISTLARAEEQLTASGTVLGTPAFAAPEQLRGREVDVRADLYAVGATLYYLLTGKPTHSDEALVSLIAAVLDEVPEAPISLRKDLPRGLSGVAMRCLEKEPDKRYRSYAELRHALLPFSSHGATPATVGMRIIAGLVDETIAFALLVLVLFSGREDPVEWALSERTPTAYLLLLGASLLQILYYAAPEARWGCTLGKALCGLRVVRPDASLPSFRRTLLRAFIFTLPFHLHHLVNAIVFSGEEYARMLAEGELNWVDVTILPLALLFFGTMRARNGYAALHDLLSGTRVVMRQSAASLACLTVTKSPAPAVGSEQIGPYAVVERLENLVVGWDAALRRFVWIPRTPVAPAARHEIARAGRLRWVAGGRSDDKAWDAFEGPEGMPLTAFLDRCQPWVRVRTWLGQISEELSASLRDGSLVSPIGFDRIWITRSGRALLLDFPAPGAAATRAFEVTDDASAQLFVSAIATGALPAVIPLHAREFLDYLALGRFETLHVVLANLRGLLNRPAYFPRSRRVISIGFPVLFATFLAAALSVSIEEAERDFETMWAHEYPGRPSLLVALHSLGAKPTLEPESFNRTMRYIGTEYGDVILDEVFWERPEVFLGIWPEYRRFAQTAALHLANPESALSAEEKALVLRQIESNELRRNHWLADPFWGALFSLLAVFLAIGALWTWIGRAPLGLDLMGAALVTREGRRASRLRAFLRSLVVLAPIFGLAVIIEMASPESTALIIVGLTVAVLLIACTIWAILRPERGPVDRIAGTWIVPR